MYILFNLVSTIYNAKMFINTIFHLLDNFDIYLLFDGILVLSLWLINSIVKVSRNTRPHSRRERERLRQRERVKHAIYTIIPNPVFTMLSTWFLIIIQAKPWVMTGTEHWYLRTWSAWPSLFHSLCGQTDREGCWTVTSWVGPGAGHLSSTVQSRIHF